MKTYTKEQIISKFNKLSNKKKVEILMKALDSAEARTDIPGDDFIILSMNYIETVDKGSYLKMNELNTEWTKDEMEEITNFKIPTRWTKKDFDAWVERGKQIGKKKN